MLRVKGLVSIHFSLPLGLISIPIEKKRFIIKHLERQIFTQNLTSLIQYRQGFRCHLRNVFSLNRIISSAFISTLIFCLTGCQVTESKIEGAFNPGGASAVTTTPFSNTWSFTSSTDYTFDSAKVEFSAGVCKLKTIDQTDNDNDATSGFGAATKNSVQWDAGNSWMEVDGTTTAKALPNSASTTSWVDMSSNKVLFHFEEAAAATSFADSSGTTSTGTCAGGACPTAGAAGKIGTALSFDGTDDYFECATGAIPTTLPITLMTWVYFNNDQAGGDYDYVFQLTTWGGTDIINMAREATTNKLYYVDNNTVKIGPVLTKQKWLHVTLVFNNTAPYVRAYLNGTEETIEQPAAAHTLSAPAKCILGRVDLGGGTVLHYLNGKVDEAAIFGRALSGTEIANIYDYQNSQYAGYFESRILNIGASVAWNALSWTPVAPYSKPLPNHSGGTPQSETLYTSGNATMTSNIVLYHFDEAIAATGLTITDYSGQGKNGTFNFNGTGTMAPTAGKINGAIYFDGTSDTVNVGNTGMTSASTTRAVWFKPTNLSSATNQYLFDFGANNNWAQLYDTDADGSLNIRTAASGYSDSTTEITESRWYHFAVTVAANGTLTIYIDGMPDPTAPAIRATINPGNLFINGFNSGTSNHFAGYMDEFVIFNRDLSASEIFDLYKRGAVRLKHQVRSCNDAACSGESFVGPGGSTTAFFSELTNLATGLPSNYDISAAIGSNQYFQYRTFLESDIATASPELKSVVIGPTHYDAGNPTVVSNTASATFQSLSQFTETLGSSNAGTVKYQLSVDGGTTWYYHNGGSWVSGASGYAQSNTAAQINSYIASFPSGASGGFKFKAFLNSSGTQLVELDELSIQGLR